MASGVTAAAAAAAAPTGLVVTFNNPLETFLLLDQRASGCDSGSGRHI